MKSGAPVSIQPTTAHSSVQPYARSDLQLATNQRTIVSRSPLPTQPYRSITLSHPLRNDVKGKNVEQDNKNKGTKKKLFKISTVAKCNKYQEYVHTTVDCTSPVKFVIINEILIVALESESTISPGITPVIKEFSVVSPATNLPQQLTLLPLPQLPPIFPFPGSVADFTFLFTTCCFLFFVFYRGLLWSSPPSSYCRPLLSLLALIANPFFLYC